VFLGNYYFFESKVKADKLLHNVKVQFYTTCVLEEFEEWICDLIWTFLKWIYCDSYRFFYRFIFNICCTCLCDVSWECHIQTYLSSLSSVNAVY